MAKRSKRAPKTKHRRRLPAADADMRPLAREELAANAQRWRETFAAAVHETTGRWTHKGIDWHAFSWDFSAALAGEEAKAAYRAKSAEALLVFFEGNMTEGYRISVSELPWFDDERLDIYICPPDFSWTMVFTHEEDFGPYFSTPEMARGARPR